MSMLVTLRFLPADSAETHRIAGQALAVGQWGAKIGRIKTNSLARTQHSLAISMVLEDRGQI